ncbi:ABC transporter permease [Jiella sonneratiae]|uniref:ABC transporter permease n=1 Tax=Jiella sonneratiae TaxID=2816856 RepID=A0ABS3J4H3_9HYPH|nr:ABC transporter permease [Jiella sonneratiae]MBO0904559.1 ABC transporter permease [Jiella sonneratiae]
MTMTTERGDDRRRADDPRGPQRGVVRLFFTRLAVQWRVIRALMIRDMIGRYGRENIGFLWLIGEPVLMIGGIIVLWSLMRGAVTHGLSVVTFALTGYSMLTLWRHMVSRGTSALRQNAGLLFHQNVKVVDTVLANIFSECIGCFVSFLFCYILLYIFGVVNLIYDPLLMALAWLGMTLFAGGFALLLGALVQSSKPFGRMLQPIMYFTLPLTGAFYLVDWMPQRAQDFLVWVPMVNAQEMFRAGFVGPVLTFHYDPWYLFLTGIIAWAGGITALKFGERKIHVG